MFLERATRRTETLPSLNFRNMLLFHLCLLVLSSVDAHSPSADSCLSSNESYALCSLTASHPLIKSKAFSKDEFHHQCDDAFAQRILIDHCHSSSSTSTKQRTPPTVLQKYLYGFLAVFIVSALSLAGLLAFPIIYKASFQYVLTLFTALAVGTLFGDTMFHLIPFALGLHGDHNDDDHQRKSFSVPEYVWKMLVSVLILYGFYLLEVLLHSFAHYKHKNTNSVHFHAHGHSHAVAHHNHSHSDGEVCAGSPVDIDADLEHGHRLHNHRHHNLHQHVANEISTASSINNAQPLVNKNNSTCVPCAYSNEIRVTTTEPDEQTEVMLPETQPKKPSRDSNKNVASPSGIEHAMKSTGWMVLIGDGIHNFADGLAIGAAFSQDLVLGMTTTLAVAFHELPHELGDYAVLIQSGFSHYRAILWNFLSATTAVIGFFIGVALSSDEKIRQWIFAVTVGMFLYIALVDLLPTLLADGQVELKRFLVVNVGFLLGITIMFLLALFEDSLIHSSHR